MAADKIMSNSPKMNGNADHGWLPKGVAASGKSLLLDLVPLVINLLLLIDIAPKEVLVSTKKSNRRMGFMDESVGTIIGCSLKNTMLLEVGMVIFRILLLE